ncbi:MAG: ComF family protein [Planktomarina sp.]|uniref:ComF family protein n=1 Tax=Planktomarina sp. TaxID=2024851 RepID=UPI003C65A468
MIYPHQCPGCRVLVQDHLHLCPECWREAHFISGCICPKCGVQMLGDHNDAHILCDDCLNTRRPWTRGRAVFLYNAKARSMILALKRKDRHDLVAPFSHWMLRRGAEIFPPAPLLIPIPLHWQRQWRRRFNQSALIAQKMARMAGIDCCLDGLKKCRRTLELKDHTAAERRKLLHASMAVNPARAGCVSGREVVLVDDVFTSGATFSEAARACLEAGAKTVSVMALARAAKPA